MRKCRQCKKEYDEDIFPHNLKTCIYCREKKIKKLQERNQEKIINFSPDQLRAINLIVQGKNVVVNSKAGTGKTTLAMEAAMQYVKVHGKGVLYLTYNKRLNKENRDKILAAGMEDFIYAHNYHSCAMWLNGSYSSSNYDRQIEKAFGKSFIGLNFNKEKPEIFPIGLLVVDEVQDMSELFEKFVDNIVGQIKTDFGSLPCILIMGDPFQCVYQFKGATPEYISEPQKIFKNRAVGSFEQVNMDTSFRITPEMAEWINKNLDPRSMEQHYPDYWKVHGNMITTLWGAGIKGNPDKKGNVFYTESIDVALVEKLYSQELDKNTVILNVSTKNNILAKLTTTMHTYAWFIDDGNSEYEVSDNIKKNKRLVTTIGKFKGLESNLVVFCGMNKYLETMAGDDPLSIYNKCYTACTRALKTLVIISGGEKYFTMRKDICHDNTIKKPICVTALSEYVPYRKILQNDDLFKTEEILNINKAVIFDEKVYIVEGNKKYKNTVESIAPYLSNVVNFRVNFLINKNQKINYLKDAYYQMRESPECKNVCEDLELWIYDHMNDDISKYNWDELLLFSIAMVSLDTRYFCKWRQLRHIKLTENHYEILNKMTQNTHELLYELLGEAQIKVESCIINDSLMKFDWIYKKYSYILGRIDYLSEKEGKVYCIESKITGDINIKREHEIQAQLYASMLELDPENYNKCVNTYLLYPAQGKLYRTTLNKWDAEKFIYEILKRKIYPRDNDIEISYNYLKKKITRYNKLIPKFIKLISNDTRSVLTIKNNLHNILGIIQYPFCEKFNPVIDGINNLNNFYKNLSQPVSISDKEKFINDIHRGLEEGFKKCNGGDLCEASTILETIINIYKA